MATKTVFVSLNGLGNSKRLRWRDSDGNDGDNDLTTKVDTDDVVEWILDPTPPAGARSIHSIEKVYKKPGNDPGNVSLLTADPTNIGGGVWQGTVVSTSPGKDKQQKYNIDFKRTPTDDTLTCDPKIQMNWVNIWKPSNIL